MIRSSRRKAHVPKYRTGTRIKASASGKAAASLILDSGFLILVFLLHHRDDHALERQGGDLDDLLVQHADAAVGGLGADRARIVGAVDADAVVNVVLEGDPPFAERILRVAVGHGGLATGNLDVGRRPPRGIRILAA